MKIKNQSNCLFIIAMLLSLSITTMSQQHGKCQQLPSTIDSMRSDLQNRMFGGHVQRHIGPNPGKTNFNSWDQARNSFYAITDAKCMCQKKKPIGCLSNLRIINGYNGTNPHNFNRSCFIFDFNVTIDRYFVMTAFPVNDTYDCVTHAPPRLTRHRSAPSLRHRYSFQE